MDKGSIASEVTIQFRMDRFKTSKDWFNEIRYETALQYFPIGEIEFKPVDVCTNAKEMSKR